MPCELGKRDRTLFFARRDQCLQASESGQVGALSTQSLKLVVDQEAVAKCRDTSVEECPGEGQKPIAEIADFSAAQSGFDKITATLSEIQIET
jgi:hypothetical protein